MDARTAQPGETSALSSVLDPVPAQDLSSVLDPVPAQDQSQLLALESSAVVSLSGC